MQAYIYLSKVLDLGMNAVYVVLTQVVKTWFLKKFGD
jgi:hypothetical protein